jgi:hypothetical protein
MRIVQCIGQLQQTLRAGGKSLLLPRREPAQHRSALIEQGLLINDQLRICGTQQQGEKQRGCYKDNLRAG